jgi:hypothetical protein
VQLLLFVNVEPLYFLRSVSAGNLVLGFAVTIETNTALASVRLLRSFAISGYEYRLILAIKTHLSHVQLGKFIYITYLIRSSYTLRCRVLLFILIIVQTVGFLGRVISS